MTTRACLVLAGDTGSTRAPIRSSKPYVASARSVRTTSTGRRAGCRTAYACFGACGGFVLGSDTCRARRGRQIRQILTRWALSHTPLQTNTQARAGREQPHDADHNNRRACGMHHDVCRHAGAGAARSSPQVSRRRHERFVAEDGAPELPPEQKGVLSP
jgi:hypothetical protein